MSMLLASVSGNLPIGTGTITLGPVGFPNTVIIYSLSNATTGMSTAPTASGFTFTKLESASSTPVPVPTAEIWVGTGAGYSNLVITTKFPSAGNPVYVYALGTTGVNAKSIVAVSNGTTTTNISPPGITPTQASNYLFAVGAFSNASTISVPSGFSTAVNSVATGTSTVFAAFLSNAVVGNSPASVTLTISPTQTVYSSILLALTTTSESSISPTNPTPTIPAGSCAPVNIISATGLNGVYALSVGALPPGFIYQWGGTSGATGYLAGSGGSTQLIICTLPGAIAGTYPITITGTPIPGSGATGGTVTTVVTVTVGSGIPDFSISCTPTNIPCTPGGSSIACQVRITSLNGFSGTIGLSLTGLPAHVTDTLTGSVAVSANNVSTGVLQLTASSAALFGISPLVLRGTSGALIHDAPLTLIMQGSGEIWGGSRRRI